ncbi:juvenile hormone acid O-methyltransferase-like [Branchiostoma floridae x Branchiostoma japonicum]
MNTTTAEHYSRNRSFQHSFGVEVLQQYMKWEGGDTVLDAGCGTGEICKYISQKPGVASVVGFDVSSEFISYASQYNSSPNVIYDVADVSDMSSYKPQWLGAFSKTVCLAVLHWVRDKGVALKAMYSCLKSRGEILLSCDTEESRIYRTSRNMSSHPKWKPYLKDFVPNLFMWPSGDLVNERSRLLQECGFEVLSCHIKEHQQPFESQEKLKETLRAIFPQLHYIPQDRREEFLDDLFQMGKDFHMISTGADCIATNDTLVLHARKL